MNFSWSPARQVAPVATTTAKANRSRKTRPPRLAPSSNASAGLVSCTDSGAGAGCGRISYPKAPECKGPSVARLPCPLTAGAAGLQNAPSAFSGGCPMPIPVRVGCVLIFLISSMLAQDRSHARSMVITRYGIVATSHVQASQAGAQILARGGSAADAAIAANAVLGVTEAMMNGIGGDLFAIYWDAKADKLYGLNASGWAPQGLTIEHLKAKGSASMPQSGIDAVTVPGAVAGWSQLHERFGRLPWKDVFQLAIFYAERGFPVPELIHDYWKESTHDLLQDAESGRIFLPNGKAPAVGQIFRNLDLAKALLLIAQEGASAFYRGKIAGAILSTSQALGGTMSPDDLTQFSPEWVKPISATYRDWTIYELPPNGQGMAALEMLNIMETSTPSPEGPLSVVELHKKIEAMKLAYADLGRYNADPRFAKIPVKGVLSKQYAKERAKLIDPAKATCEVTAGAPPSSDTTYLSVVDREGNIVSLIQSNYAAFGSGITVRGMGFVLQNRGALFTLDPLHPNALAPRKRPSTPLFQPSWSAETSTLASASWAERTSPSPTLSLCPT